MPSALVEDARATGQLHERLRGTSHPAATLMRGAAADLVWQVLCFNIGPFSPYNS